MMRGGRWAVAILSLCAVGLIAWSALAPIHVATHEQLFEIPKGTYARRMSGDKVEILPPQIDLTLGLNDVLLMRNNDDVPQLFGPVLIMPGQEFRLPFRQASDYQFACTAHLSGQMTISVAPEATPGWRRLVWRGRALFSAASRQLH